jgi:hypothetical protein
LHQRVEIRSRSIGPLGERSPRGPGPLTEKIVDSKFVDSKFADPKIADPKIVA